MPNLHSLLIEHHGQIVTEAYGTGADSPITERYGIGNPFAADVDFDAETLHDIRSIGMDGDGEKTPNLHGIFSGQF